MTKQEHPTVFMHNFVSFRFIRAFTEETILT